MKARSDSLFAKLKPAQREELLMQLNGGMKLDDAAAQCSKWGIKASPVAVSRFYSVHSFAWRLERASAAAAASMNVSPEAAEQAKSTLLAKKIFEAVADADCSPKVLIALRGLELDAQKVRLAERRVTILEKKLSEGKAAMTDTKLTPAEREFKLREVFGL